MLIVTVNDRPIDVAAIVERGRVLLPMRATFTALGATLGYDARGGVIVARSATHSVRIRLGSYTATVDGKGVRLDVPAQVIAARTYVPVRFVAQSMGAVVGYNARANLVSIVSEGKSGAALHGADVVSLSPSPSSIVNTAYPTISASLGDQSAAGESVALTLDGEDVTALATFDGSTITYMPRIGLSRGRHTVVFSGHTLAQQTFSASWTFETSLQAPPDAPALNGYDYRFYANGASQYYPGDWMHFTLVAPPGGSAQIQLCNLGYQYALYNNGSGTIYEANFPAPNGYWIPSCTVTAIYTGWNGQQYYVPIPVIVGIYTGQQRGRPTPTPAPASRPVPHPGGPRRTPPPSTPAPAPAHTTAPIPKPTSLPTAAPTTPPRPQHTPVPHPLPHPIPRKTP